MFYHPGVMDNVIYTTLLYLGPTYAFNFCVWIHDEKLILILFLFKQHKVKQVLDNLILLSDKRVGDI